MKRTWVYYAMLVLIAEKIIQHTAVSLAFYFNWTQIRSTVAVNPEFLMISGAIVALLFVVGLWGMATRRTWAVPLAMVLAVFDLVGEFIAQGEIGITLTVSFIVAAALLGLAVAYSRQTRKIVASR
jgi:hypothetical protein